MKRLYDASDRETRTAQNLAAQASLDQLVGEVHGRTQQRQDRHAMTGAVTVGFILGIIISAGLVLAPLLHL